MSRHSPRADREQRTFDALPLDEAVAASYGQVAAAVVDAGRNPRARSMDLLIAATAHAHSARLYTRNRDDFEDLADLVEVVAVRTGPRLSLLQAPAGVVPGRGRGVRTL
jgi:predicted nucleic acid-binding protein